MNRPTVSELKLVNPGFFDPVWDQLFGSMDVVPDPQGGWELIVDGKFSRPVYKITRRLELIYDREEI